MAQRIWDKTDGDKEKQQKIISLRDRSQHDAYMLAAMNGQYESLNWLLNLNDDNKEGDAEDEANLTRHHPSNQKTPLMLCVAADVRRKSDNKDDKVLTEEEKQNYFKCVQLIFSKCAKNKWKDLVLAADSTDANAMYYSCTNANVQVSI